MRNRQKASIKNDEPYRAEDDAESHAGQIPSRRQPTELMLDEIEFVLDRREVAAGLVGLADHAGECVLVAPDL
jgi:hypothetical protein